MTVKHVELTYVNYSWLQLAKLPVLVCLVAAMHAVAVALGLAFAAAMLPGGFVGALAPVLAVGWLVATARAAVDNSGSPRSTSVRWGSGTVVETDWRGVERVVCTFADATHVRVVCVATQRMGREWSVHHAWRVEVHTRSAAGAVACVYEDWSRALLAPAGVVERALQVAEMIGVKVQIMPHACR